MSCPHADSCAMYPYFKMQSLLRLWITSYCQADYHACARFKRSSEGKPVPPTLLPSGSLLDLRTGETTALEGDVSTCDPLKSPTAEDVDK